MKCAALFHPEWLEYGGPQSVDAGMETTYPAFEPGQKVKTIYGELRTVLMQHGGQMWLEEECFGWHHPANLWAV